MPFLILHKTGPQLEESEIAAVIEGKTKDEANQAIAEGATKGPGSYAAIFFNTKNVVTRDAHATVEVTEPDEP